VGSGFHCLRVLSLSLGMLPALSSSHETLRGTLHGNQHGILHGKEYGCQHGNQLQPPMALKMATLNGNHHGDQRGKKHGPVHDLGVCANLDMHIRN
jgi:hypothetical protein